MPATDNWEYRTSGYVPRSVVHDNQCRLWEIVSFPSEVRVRARLLKSRVKQVSPVTDVFMCENIRPIGSSCPNCKTVYEGLPLDNHAVYNQFTCIGCKTIYKFSTSKSEFIGKNNVTLNLRYVPLPSMKGILGDIPVSIKRTLIHANKSGFPKVIVNPVTSVGVAIESYSMESYEESGLQLPVNTDENIEVYEMKDGSWATLDGKKLKIMNNSYVRNPTFSVEV